ncbi:MAG: hypothetical protein ACK5QT_11705 [Oligoflexia bacterium]
MISKLIEWGLVVAAAGQLKGATLAMLKYAARGHRDGVASLVEINRAFVRRPHAKKTGQQNGGPTLPAAKCGALFSPAEPK